MRHLAREPISGREPCHVTLKVAAGLRTLRDVRIVRALEATFRAVLGRPDFRVVEYSVRRVDPASSGRWFSGWGEGVEALRRSPTPRPAPVAQALTWLLRVGCRRHGLLDPSEVPGLRAT